MEIKGDLTGVSGEYFVAAELSRLGIHCIHKVMAVAVAMPPGAPYQPRSQNQQ
jgi:hypothetical protein